MIVLNEKNIGAELQRWFSKSIVLFDNVDFNDIDIFKKVLKDFIFDYKRYYPKDEEIILRNLILRHELIGILLYRISRSYFLSGKEDIAVAYSSLGAFLSGFEIYYSAEIGKGVKINHGLGTVIGARVVIGDNALLHQGITFGDRNGGRPKLLNNVIVYAGSTILGDVTLGNHCVIGANSLCMVSVPDNEIYGGNPAKFIRKNI